MKKLVSLTVAILSGAAICAALSVSPVGVSVSDAQAATICGGTCPGTESINCQNCSGQVIVAGIPGYGETETDKPANTDYACFGGHCCYTYCFNGGVPCD